MQMENGIINMKQEDKDLLLRYLSMALPYYVQVKTEGDNEPYTLLSVHPNKDIALIGIDIDGVYATSKVKIDTIKPYLRSISDMTEEEVDEYENLKADINDKLKSWKCFRLINWLLEHHFDFLNFISQGLAIEATKENNPYNITENILQ